MNFLIRKFSDDSVFLQNVCNKKALFIGKGVYFYSKKKLYEASYGTNKLNGINLSWDLNGRPKDFSNYKRGDKRGIGIKFKS